MSWVPPHLAKPNCAQCSYQKHTGITVQMMGQVLALRECRLHDERRYWFRKNPPLPNMSSNGANCKRYCPAQACGSKMEDDWVEFPSPPVSGLERKAKRPAKHEQEKS